jgi:hypothetical protein
MSLLSEWFTTNGLTKGQNIRSALTSGVSNFVGPDRKPLTIKNAADPLFRGIGSKNKYERIAGAITAAIFGAYGLSALGGGAAEGADAGMGGAADAGTTDLGGFGGMLGGTESGGSGFGGFGGAGGGFTSEAAPDPTEGFSSNPWDSASESITSPKSFGSGNSGGSNNNSYDNYQRMKIARAIHEQKMAEMLQQNQVTQAPYG